MERAVHVPYEGLIEKWNSRCPLRTKSEEGTAGVRSVQRQ